MKFISLTVEPKDDAEAVASWLARAKAASLDAGRASPDATKRLYRMGGAREGVLPTTVFITADGNVAGAHTGAITRAQLDEMLRKIVP